MSAASPLDRYARAMARPTASLRLVSGDADAVTAGLAPYRLSDPP